MGIPRSNSPSTVAHRAGGEGKKDLLEIPHGIESEPSKQQGGQRLHFQRSQSFDETDDSTSSIHDLKNELRALLSENNGCTKDEEVADIVAKLSESKSCAKGCANLDYFPGDYITLSIPNFPGRIKPTNESEEDIVQYTLGKLSFNIFQPNELVCTVNSIHNHLQPKRKEREENEEDVTVFSYDFIVDLTIHTPDGDLGATLINKAFCRETENRNNRMSVTFAGATLIPGHETSKNKSMLALWERTFAKAYERAREERSIWGWIYHYCLVFFLGLTLPTDFEHMGKSRIENSFHFDIKRPPKGFFDVLYIDEDMRITKGNRGTITVLERTSSNGFSQ